MLTVLLLLLGAAESAPPLAESIKARFVAEVSPGMEGYRVCEAFSKNDDRRAFFRRALGLDAISGATSFESREVFVEDSASPRKAHLGILIVHYPDASGAQRIQGSLTRPEQYFRGTEILTRYVSLARADAVVILYSETALNERVKSFLDKAPRDLAEAK